MEDIKVKPRKENEIMPDTVEKNPPVATKSPEVDPMNWNWNSTWKKLEEFGIKQDLADKQVNTKTKLDAVDGNETIIPEREKHPDMYYNPIALSKETLITDTTVKTFCNQMDAVSTKLNIEIEKSTALVKTWGDHLIALDNYIKSLSSWPWGKFMKYSACTLTILAFMYKMGAMRMLPNFASTAINLIPTNAISSAIQDSKGIEIPKPSFDNTLNTIMQTPLTPITLLTCIGGLTITMGLLKSVLWILQKSPK